MNVGQIKTRVYRLFGDEAQVQITDADIIRWINDGQRKICLENEGMLQTSALTSSVADQQDYALPADLLVLRSVYFKRQGQNTFYRLKYMSLQDFDESVDGWDGDEFGNSWPTIYTAYAGEILLFPKPSYSASNNIKLYYSKAPVDVDDDSDTPILPEIYHNALVDYCMSQAYLLDEDWNAAGNITQKMQSDINKLKSRESSTINNFEAYPRITVQFDDLW